MAKFTFLEVHLEDATFGGIDTGTQSASEDPDPEPVEEPESGGGGVLAAVLVSLVLAVAATLAARKLFGGDEPDEGTEDDGPVDLEIGSDD